MTKESKPRLLFGLDTSPGYAQMKLDCSNVLRSPRRVEINNQVQVNKVTVHYIKHPKRTF